jgi:riboflavin kinase / FMN adenylyltransferase
MKILTVGFFDGVHRGHQHLFHQMKQLGGRTVVITFSNHPAEVLGRPVPLLLTPLSRKLELIKKQGIDEIIVLEFTDSLAQCTYDQFLAPYFFLHLVLGQGTTLGRGRIGTSEELRRLGRERGFTLHLVEQLRDEGGAISSTRIRAALQNNRKEEAERLLGWRMDV